MSTDDPLTLLAMAAGVLLVLLAIGVGAVLWGRKACRHPQTREESNDD